MCMQKLFNLLQKKFKDELLKKLKRSNRPRIDFWWTAYIKNIEQAAIVSRAKSHCSTLVEKDKIRSMKTIGRKGSIDDSENLNFITSQIVLRLKIGPKRFLISTIYK